MFNKSVFLIMTKIQKRKNLFTRHKKEASESDEVTTNFIVNAYKTVGLNQAAYHFVYPEYFKPFHFLYNIEKTRLTTYKSNHQYTVTATRPHCFIAFAPETIYRNVSQACLLIASEQHISMDGDGQRFSFGPMGAVFGSLVIVSAYVKVHFTRNTNGFFRHSEGHTTANGGLILNDFTYREPIEESFIFRYKPASFDFNLRTTVASEFKANMIQLYGLEAGLVLDIEFCATICGTPTATSAITHEFEKNTYRNDQRSNTVRVIKRLLENFPKSLEYRPLTNPITENVINESDTHDSDPMFLFPTKNHQTMKNFSIIQNVVELGDGSMGIQARNDNHNGDNGRTHSVVSRRL
jgi:hypothetical protein